ncbi:heparan N-sulfatase [Puteibacter caeruleilacunae]|nr:heparan N-sulfatase [Puteibacter caeruleilacunae]
MRLSCIIIAVLTILGLALRAEERPNIILIIADDLSSDDLSCYGNKGIKTPALQALAESGIVFNNAYLTAANCSPSRASIATGRWPISNGQTDLSTGALPSYNVPYPEFFDGIDYFPQVLQKAGYYTAQSGKWHIGYDWNKATGPVANGFDKTDTKTGQSGCENWIKVLDERPKDKPFFMWFAAHDPHDPWTAPKIHNPDSVFIPPYISDTRFQREQLAKYYDEIYRMDSYIGKVIEKLKQQEVYENTLIVFISDNGRGFWRSKAYIYDAGMKTPLLVSWPKAIKENQEGNQLISSIDLAPTFVELAGLNPEDYTFQGQSVASIWKDLTRKELNNYVISEQHWHGFRTDYRSVRDKDGFLYVWNGHPEQNGVCNKAFMKNMIALNDEGKLSELQKDPFRYPREVEELYDFKNDPHQTKNLVKDPKFRKKLKELRRVLAKWKELTGDCPSKKEIPDWYQRPYSDVKPQKGVWGLPPGTRNYGVGEENKVRRLVRD